MTGANSILKHCHALAAMSEEAGFTTRTFLSPPMREVHAYVRAWMDRLGMSVTMDAAGNLRAFYDGRKECRLLIGSHVDTVPHAGAYDGVLGVVLGLALIESLAGRRLAFGIEVVAFSEEEGVRFQTPFIGSKALIGALDQELLARKDMHGITVEQAIRAYGLDPAATGDARIDKRTIGYFEMHIEQGPVLESLNLPLGVVSGIVGQSRARVRFRGAANHAGTTPMHLRRDALAGAAQWILNVEQTAHGANGLVATAGTISVIPGAGNIVPGEASVSLDVRHSDDAVRDAAVQKLKDAAQSIAKQRGLSVEWTTTLEQAAVGCDAGLTRMLERGVMRAGFPLHVMPSGAGHDAMILAAKVPVAILFLRSPGGISHNPDESVLPEDVDAALNAGLAFLEELEKQYA